MVFSAYPVMLMHWTFAAAAAVGELVGEATFGWTLGV